MLPVAGVKAHPWMIEIGNRRQIVGMHHRRQPQPSCETSQPQGTPTVLGADLDYGPWSLPFQQLLVHGHIERALHELPSAVPLMMHTLLNPQQQRTGNLARPGPPLHLGGPGGRCGHRRLQAGQALGPRPAQRARGSQSPSEADRLLELAPAGQVAKTGFAADRLTQGPVTQLAIPAEMQHPDVPAAPAGPATVHLDILYVELNVPGRIEFDRRGHLG